MGRGLVANQYANTAVKAPMPTSVDVGRERKNWLSSSISGILRPLMISWACIFSISVELNSAGQRTPSRLQYRRVNLFNCKISETFTIYFNPVANQKSFWRELFCFWLKYFCGVAGNPHDFQMPTNYRLAEKAEGKKKEKKEVDWD